MDQETVLFGGLMTNERSKGILVLFGFFLFRFSLRLIFFTLCVFVFPVRRWSDFNPSVIALEIDREVKIPSVSTFSIQESGFFSAVLCNLLFSHFVTSGLGLLISVGGYFLGKYGISLLDDYGIAKFKHLCFSWISETKLDSIQWNKETRPKIENENLKCDCPFAWQTEFDSFAIRKHQNKTTEWSWLQFIEYTIWRSLSVSFWNAVGLRIAWF